MFLPGFEYFPSVGEARYDKHTEDTEELRDKENREQEVGEALDIMVGVIERDAIHQALATVSVQSGYMKGS